MLGRLAIAKSHQSQGLGRALFRDLALHALSAANSLGIRGMQIHAISEETKEFCIALGLDVSPFEPMTLLATLADRQTQGIPIYFRRAQSPPFGRRRPNEGSVAS